MPSRKIKKHEDEKHGNIFHRTIYVADNLPILRGIESECIDLIYLDPPFNKNRKFEAPIGSEAAGAAFTDIWTLDDEDLAWHATIRANSRDLYVAIEAAKAVHSKGMMSYLIYMSIRIIEMHRILKSTGTLYIHCDSTASHYLKILLDAIFGRDQFQNEVIWHYGKMSNTKKNFPRNHDTIFRYTKSNHFTFNSIRGADSEYKERFKSVLKHNKVHYGAVKGRKDKLILRRVAKIEGQMGRKLRDDDVLFDFDTEFKVQSDVIYESIIKGNSSERVGYPTQKPLKLLRKLVAASSNEGDMILDPFCGCATTLIAAEDLQRHWVGIDISERAGELVENRMINELGLSSARVIWRSDPPERNGKPSKNIKNILYGNQGGNCNLCGTHFVEARHLELDHIIPKSQGGLDVDSNLQLLCGNCNRIKGTETMERAIVRLRSFQKSQAGQ